jgi:hypothetical protein
MSGESTGKIKRVMPKGRPWVKGQSGNPGGRPKDLAWLRETARSHAPEALETLFKIMRDGGTEKDRRAAAEALLDRGFGKAAIVQSGEGGEGEAGITITIRDLAAERGSSSK